MPPSDRRRNMKLSILMPVFNEEATLALAVKRALSVNYPCDVELVIVDDGSTDGTAGVLWQFDDDRLVKVEHPVNRGKGAAVRSAAANATGDYMVVLDSDLEYAPEELPALLMPVVDGDAEVVYGTRTFSSHTAYSFWYVMGNKLVTLWANILFDSWISDLETCFKLMPLELYRSLDIRSEGFGMEAELTGKLLARGYRPYEVPISYVARSREAGKKLTSSDGVEALWILARQRLSGRRRAAGLYRRWTTTTGTGAGAPPTSGRPTST
jgi:dolichol-phosphate hexosyltransferase